MTVIADKQSQVNSGTDMALRTANAATDNLAKETEDRFLTLLVTQLQNQDPLNPMDNADVTSQIAQLSTVNGINQLNSTLLALSGQIDIGQSMQASALIGKGVLVPGEKISLGSKSGDDQVREATPFGVDLVSPATDVVVTIVDDSGRPVRKMELGPKEVGVISLSWDGLDDSGAPVADGSYRVQVAATDAEGGKVLADPLSYGLVNSVAYTSQGLRLELGLAGQASLLDIRKIM